MKSIFKTLFRNDRKESDQIVPYVSSANNAIEHEHISSPITNISHQLLVGYSQSIGKQRDHNEDALFSMTTSITSGDEISEFGLYIIADGMGGHQHGEIASELAIRSLSGYVIRKVFTPIFSSKPSQPQDSLQEIMREGMLEAHRSISRQAPGSGTTMTSVLLIGDQITIAHVGDSRAYAIKQNGEIQCLTRDHSLVNRLLELGQLTADEAANHPQRNVLYRALGQGESFEPDVQNLHINQTRFLLICSDGLWGSVSDSNIVKIIHDSENPDQACQKLVDAANDAGGPDNISTILIKIPQ